MSSEFRMFASHLFFLLLFAGTVSVLCHSDAALYVPIPVDCGANRTFHYRTQCEQTCLSYRGASPSNLICGPGCRCSTGYVKDIQENTGLSSRCVKPEDCKQYRVRSKLGRKKEE